jgi:hypothetical protein
VQLRPYQHTLSDIALTKLPFVYLNIEVRCGKTLIALETCRKAGAKRVLFITKIKAFSSIKNDAKGYDFDLTIINKESIHKVEGEYDIIVCDEAHGLFGTFPKPNNFTKYYKKRFANVPCIMLSGTMTPESYSQLFHQFWVNAHAPFSSYQNFYKWANDYVNVKKRYLGYAEVNDYSDANKDKFWHLVEPHIITFTQKEAGFESVIEEMVLRVPMQPITKEIIKRLEKDLVVTSKDGKVILADTGVKLMQKIHQICSGTVKFEDGTHRVIDKSKGIFIKNKFKRVAIFYKFKAELEMLLDVFGDDLTTDIETFNNDSSKSIALQIVSGREGINLSKAEYIVFLNIDFSAVSYWQARDRMTTMERKENIVYWIFSEGGIEDKIYKAVQGKKNYTLSNFKHDRATNTI